MIIYHLHFVIAIILTLHLEYKMFELIALTYRIQLKQTINKNKKYSIMIMIMIIDQLCKLKKNELCKSITTQIVKQLANKFYMKFTT